MEFVIATQAVVIIALSGILVRSYDRLFRAAMSRTPGEYRAAEREAARKPQTPAPNANLVGIDEAAQAVLESMASDHPMPHGLGGI